MNAFIIPVLFHALPLIPVLFQLYWLAAAAALLIVLAYVKVQKLQHEVDDLKIHEGHAARLADAEKRLRLWRSLTFPAR